MSVLDLKRNRYLISANRILTLVFDIRLIEFFSAAGIPVMIHYDIAIKVIERFSHG